MDVSKVKAEKRPIKEDSDDEPLSARMEKKVKVEKTKKRKNDDDDFSPIEKVT